MRWNAAMAPVLAVPLLAVLLAMGAVTAWAQPVPVTPDQGNGGVLRPKGDIDPSMTRMAPAVPQHSTPVIHPRTVRKGRHGRVVVQPR